MNEQEAYIALNMMEKVGPVSVRSLKALLGSAVAIFEADERTLRQAEGVGSETALAIIRQRDAIDWKGEVERAAAHGARLVTQVDGEYPRALLQIHDPPLALYVRGSLEQRDKHSIAVVGTRHPSRYGNEMARKFSAQLARAGMTVVSGLAEGVDLAAHEGALEGKGRTLAVIGSGFDHIYPKSNIELADRVAASGAVISEFPVGRQPDRTTFPMRNRIVSGMTMGTLVVEAGQKSGALITANQALEQGRTVFAIPGRIDSHVSSGTNALIKTGAKLVTCVEDILQEYEFLIPADIPQRAARPAGPAAALTGEEQSILKELEQGEQDVDALIRACGLKPSAVNALLIGLELKRKVRMMPGRMVELLS